MKSRGLISKVRDGGSTLCPSSELLLALCVGAGQEKLVGMSCVIVCVSLRLGGGTPTLICNTILGQRK